MRSERVCWIGGESTCRCATDRLFAPNVFPQMSSNITALLRLSSLILGEIQRTQPCKCQRKPPACSQVAFLTWRAFFTLGYYRNIQWEDWLVSGSKPQTQLLFGLTEIIIDSNTMMLLLSKNHTRARISGRRRVSQVRIRDQELSLGMLTHKSYSLHIMVRRCIHAHVQSQILITPHMFLMVGKPEHLKQTQGKHADSTQKGPALSENGTQLWGDSAKHSSTVLPIFMRLKSPFLKFSSSINDISMERDRTYAEADKNRLAYRLLLFHGAGWTLPIDAPIKQISAVLHITCTATCCPQTVPVHPELVVLSALRSTDLERTECLYY